MATPVQFVCSSGLTLSIELYPYASDTIANGAGGDAATEKTNCKSLYEASIAESLTGWHNARIKDAGGATVAQYHVYMRATTAIHRCEEAPAKMYDGEDVPQANVIEWLGTGQTPDTAGYPKVTIKDGTGQGEILTSGGAIDIVLETFEVDAIGIGGVASNSFAAGAINAAAIAADAIGSSELATSAVDKITTAILTTPANKLTTDASGRALANADQIAGSGPAATNQSKAALCIGRGVVTTGASTTSIPTSSITPAAGVTDQFKDRVVIFDSDTTTANLRGVAAVISASTSGGTLTVSTLPATPANTDSFGIY